MRCASHRYPSRPHKRHPFVDFEHVGEQEIDDYRRTKRQQCKSQHTHPRNEAQPHGHQRKDVHHGHKHQQMKQADSAMNLVLVQQITAVFNANHTPFLCQRRQSHNGQIEGDQGHPDLDIREGLRECIPGFHRLTSYYAFILSMFTIVAPFTSANKRFIRFEPINPAPPVTKILFIDVLLFLDSLKMG